jgi:hypothetical protein
LFADGSIDFLMIDDLHEHNHLAWEIKKYSPKISKGGIMSIDDLNAPPLRGAVYRTIGQEHISIIDGCVGYAMQVDLWGVK